MGVGLASSPTISLRDLSKPGRSGGEVNCSAKGAPGTGLAKQDLVALGAYLRTISQVFQPADKTVYSIAEKVHEWYELLHK